MNNTLKMIGDIGIIPAVSVKADAAADFVKAFASAELPLMQLNFTDKTAKEAIIAAKKALPEAIIGAGRVASFDDIKAAIEAGADFIALAGYDRELMEIGLAAGVTVIPSCSSATEIAAAMKLGLDTVAVFPADIEVLKAYAEKFPEMKFIPEGGINLSNIGSFAKLKCVLALGYSFPGSDALTAEALSKAAVKAMFGYKFLHMGINAEDKAESAEWAFLLEKLFGFEAKETAISYFSSTDIEIMSGGGRGKNGHVGVGTNCIYRSMEWFKKAGYEPNFDTARYDANGNINFIYIDKDICGFAFHLNQRA